MNASNSTAATGLSPLGVSESVGKPKSSQKNEITHTGVKLAI
jgi:hypothetical protein